MEYIKLSNLNISCLINQKKYHVTYNNLPYGYCAEWEDWPNIMHMMFPENWQEHKNNEFKYGHTHSTRNEAIECYTDYLLENYAVYKIKALIGSICEICNEDTNLQAGIKEEPLLIYLCEFHNQEKYLKECLKISSYLNC